MRLWRIARAAYPPFDGAGGLHGAGRWHSAGRRIVYCASTPADAQLEILVHLEVDIEDLPVDLRLYALDLPDDFDVRDCPRLPPDWRARLDVSRAYGDAWLDAGDAPALRVPSAITPHSSNVLLNPEHSAFGVLKPSIDEPLLLDPRLLRARG